MLYPYNKDLLIQEVMVNGTTACSWDGLEQLCISGIISDSDFLLRFLQDVRPTRLYLDDSTDECLALVLDSVDISKLEELSIRYSEYDDTEEQLLARNINEFTESLVIYLDNASSNLYTANGGRPRTTEGSPTSLPRHRVKLMGDIDFQEHHYRFLKPILPSYSY